MEEIAISKAVNEYDYIKLTVADINGVSRGKIITKVATKKCLTSGTEGYAGVVGFGFDGAVFFDQLNQGSQGNEGNGVWVPKLETLRYVNEATSYRNEYRIGEVYCEVMYNSPEGPVVQTSCPRYMARNQLEILRSMGYELYSAFEHEMLIVDDEKTLEPLFSHMKFVYSNSGLMKCQEMMMEVLERSKKQGLKIEACHLEYSPGQVEFVALPQTGIQSVDNNFAFKDVLREVVNENGKQASYMTCLSTEYSSSSGFHFNHSLRSVSGNKPACYDESNDLNLSDACINWVGGLIKHLPALTALCCPTVNCYRRLGKTFAPVKSNWGIDDRIATIRVKNSSPQGCYVELRLPSSAANPYIVVAATIAAGIDGLENKYKCPPTRTDGEEGENLPTTLYEALEALKEDTVLTEALGEEFITWFTLMKKAEIERFGGSDVSDDSDDRMNKERELYMDML